jgi:hypothetical protein
MTGLRDSINRASVVEHLTRASSLGPGFIPAVNPPLHDATKSQLDGIAQRQRLQRCRRFILCRRVLASSRRVAVVKCSCQTASAAVAIAFCALPTVGNSDFGVPVFLIVVCQHASGIDAVPALPATYLGEPKPHSRASIDSIDA